MNHDILFSIARSIEAGRDANRSSRDIAEALLLQLDRDGFTVKAKPRPRKPKAVAEDFNPNTGDPALDDFMRRKHTPGWAAPRLKITGGMPAAGKLSDKRRAAMERTWQGAVDAVKKLHADGEESHAIAAWRDAIAMHRSTWRRIGDDRWARPERAEVELRRENSPTGPGKVYRVYLDGQAQSRRDTGHFFRHDDALAFAEAL